MTEEKKLDLMKKFKELNVAEYTTKYGDFYGLMFAGAEIVTKELQEELSKKADIEAEENELENTPKADKWALECNLDFDRMFLKDLEKGE